MTYRATDPLTIPESFWDRPEVIGALSRQDITHLFRLLQEHIPGSSQTRIGAACILDQSKVSRIISGTYTVKELAVFRRIADGLQMPNPARLALGLAPLMSRHAAKSSANTAQLPVGRLETSAAGPQILSPARAGTLRRPESPSSSFATRAVPTTSKQATRFIPVRSMSTAQIKSVVRSIANEYLTSSPSQVYAKAALLTEQLFTHTQEVSPATSDRMSDLYSILGYLYAIQAWIAGDLGHRPAAAAHARSGWMCAELADDDTLRAWTLSAMSKSALWEGRHEEAAILAARGSALNTVGSVKVLLACQEADAWAEHGTRDRAQEALSSIHSGLGDSIEADEIGGLLSCGDLRRFNYTGAVLLRTGNTGEAIEMAAAALDVAREDSTAAFGTVAQIRVWTAKAFIEHGDIGSAADVLQPLLDAPPNMRLETIARRANEIRSAIAARPHLRQDGMANELTNAISHFCALTVSHEVPY